MRVLITGATAFIGRALVPILRGEGHQLIALVRSEPPARSLLGAEVETVELSSGAKALRRIPANGDSKHLTALTVKIDQFGTSACRIIENGKEACFRTGTSYPSPDVWRGPGEKFELNTGQPFTEPHCDPA